jgi:hypothetical protein
VYLVFYDDQYLQLFLYDTNLYDLTAENSDDFNMIGVLHRDIF